MLASLPANMRVADREGFVSPEFRSWLAEALAPHGHTHDARDLVSGFLEDARVDDSNVLQHVSASGGATAWGDITGTLSDQSDLQTALDGKAASSHNHAAGDINSGTFADARIAASNVTQHQAALAIAFTQLTGSIANGQVPQSAVTQHQAALSITESQISDLTTALPGVFSGTGTHSLTTGSDTVIDLSSEVLDPDSAYSLVSDAIVVANAGYYMIHAQVHVDLTTSGAVRDDCRVTIEIDTGGGFAQLEDAQVFSYMRETVSAQTVNVIALVQLSADDELRYVAQRTSYGTDETVDAAKSRFHIFRVRK